MNRCLLVVACSVLLTTVSSESAADVAVGGYVQPQLFVGPDSTSFRIRRARPKLTLSRGDARFVLEIDPFPTGGPAEGTGTIARDTFARYLFRPSGAWTGEITAGIFKVPLSGELLESSGDRIFTERSWASRNWFPSERDTGLWLRLQRKSSALDVAVLNGVVQGEPGFAVVADTDRRKDVMVRGRANLGPIAVGLGFYVGWAGTTPRWAARVEAEWAKRVVPRLGNTRVMFELTVAENLDRGVRYAFATPADDRLGQRGMFLRLEQSLPGGMVIAVRYDHYSPDVSTRGNSRDTAAIAVSMEVVASMRVVAELARAFDRVRARGDEPTLRVLDTLVVGLVFRL